MRPVEDPAVPDVVSRLQGITTYSEIEEVMKSPDFAMAGLPERRYFLGDTLILAEGDRHRELKQLFSPLMSLEAMAYYELRLIEPVVAQSMADIEAARRPDGTVHIDLVPLIYAALTRIAARVTGADNVDTPERTERFRDLVLVLSAATTGSFSTVPHAEMLRSGREALRALVDEFLAASLERRKDLVRRHRAGEIGKEELPRDVLTSLCLADDLVHPGDEGAEIPYLWRQCALFLTASIKTTSHALPHVFVHLDEWVREHPHDKPKLTDDEFLHRAAAESFRLHQSTPARFRSAVRDVTLSSGRTVAAGEMVALHAPIANVEPETFGPDGRYFDPWREVPAGINPWGMTFGLGAHSCMGRNLVTGIRNRGDDRHGTHGTAVRILKALYERGAALDPDNPPKRPEHSLHDIYESVPIVLRP